ncbi:MAG TPA: hypothetical protein VFU80_01405 [Sphingomicrobium sp.]|nr:hypothetical protein [Sphingomicrobium sp.]
MKARWRILVAASAALLGAGTPALAQETAPPQESAPAQNEVVGPPQLRDFSINGTVTREAPAPVPVQNQPVQRPAASAAGGQASQSTASRPAQTTRQTAQSAGTDSATRQAVQPIASATVSRDVAATTTGERIAAPTVSATDDLSSLDPQPAFVPAPADPNLAPERNQLPMLPWLIAALAAAGAAAWYFLRHRPSERYAGAGAGALAFQAPTPASQPAPPSVRKPQPAAPATPSPSGVVSTRLRPWLELEFVPQRGVVDEQKAAVAFELSVYNSGSVPARDVLLEASLFNAGPMQDQQIRLFFENPVAKGDRIPVIAPLQRITVNTAVFLARDQVRAIEVEGRPLFVPMIAFNALYGWGSSTGQTSASYLVGKTTKGEKLAPFRLDMGPRIFRSLAAREHELRLRN